MSKLLSLLLLLAILGAASAHPGKHVHPRPKKPFKPIKPIIKPKPKPTVFGLVAKTKSLDILQFALKTTGLDAALKKSSFNGTVFAPTDKAFKNLFAKLSLSLKFPPFGTKAFLTKVLKYHVLAAAVKSSAIPKLPKTISAPTLLGPNITAFKSGHPVSVTIKAALSKAKVVKADITVNKAVVHIIDEVLLPGALKEGFPGCKSVAGVAKKGGLKTLLKALHLANLTSTFTAKNFTGTVLAPTDAAFAKLLKKLKLKKLSDVPVTTLTAVLKYHVIPAYVPAIDVKPNAAVPTLLGSNVTSLISPSGLIFFRSESKNLSKVLKPDLFACKAVVHVISDVLIPAP